MPTLNAAQRSLVMAEISAHAIISSVDLDGSLSSAFHLRHKIRATDIKSFVETVTKTLPHTLERMIHIAHLFNMASAAYCPSSVSLLLGATDFQCLVIRRHFDNEFVNFRANIENEPMNLWLGVGKENLQSNNSIRDLHQFDEVLHGNVKFQVARVENVSGAQRTTNSALYLGRHAPGGITGVLAGAPPPQLSPAVHGLILVPPLLTREPTPTSSALRDIDLSAPDVEITEKGCPRGRDLIAPPAVSALIRSVTTRGLQKDASLAALNLQIEQYRMRLLAALDKVIASTKKTTSAGAEHYNVLINQLLLRGVQQDSSDLKLLRDAHTGWTENRNSLLTALDFKKLNFPGQKDISINRGFVAIPDGHFLLAPSATTLIPDTGVSSTVASVDGARRTSKRARR